jgi:hypothetical protein
MKTTKGINHWLELWASGSTEGLEEKQETYKKAVQHYKEQKELAALHKQMELDQKAKEKKEAEVLKQHSEAKAWSSWDLQVKAYSDMQAAQAKAYHHQKKLQWEYLYGKPHSKIHWKQQNSKIHWNQQKSKIHWNPQKPKIPWNQQNSTDPFILQASMAPLDHSGKPDPARYQLGLTQGSIEVYYQCSGCGYSLVYTHPHRCKTGGKLTVRWSDAIPKTQKALGISALAIGAAREENYFYAIGGPFHKALLFSNEKHVRRIQKIASEYKGKYKKGSPLDYLPKAKESGLFARPCPATPRHGFVDSRVIEPTWKAVIELMKEVKEADPKGELILQEYHKSTHSVVFVPRSGSLSIGPGNDGATAGKGAIVLPTVPAAPKLMGVSAPVEFARNSKIDLKNGEHEHFEGVYFRAKSHDGYTIPVETRWVQVRGAPPVPEGAISDFIPRKMKVKDIYNACEIEDLLWWEKECQSLKKKKGLVVYSPGASLASHMAIHCILNDIPIMTSREPKFGEELIPPKRKRAKIDWDEFDEGVSACMGISATRKDFTSEKPSWDIVGRIVSFCVGTMHNAPALQYSPHYSKLMGFAAQGLLLAGAISSSGEARHFKRFKECYELGEGSHMNPAPNRRLVWSKVWADRHDHGKTLKHLQDAKEKFRQYEVWAGKDDPSSTHDYGYGGPRWEAVTVHSIELLKAMQLRKSMPNIVKAMNVLVNTVHNGGPCLNKLVDRNTLDYGAKNPGSILASHGLVFRDIFNLEGNSGTTG